jgi:hypothetical protein
VSVAGTGAGSFSGGNAILVAGQGGDTGNGGDAAIYGGDGGATSGNSGSVTLSPGSVGTGTQGAIVILAPGGGTATELRFREDSPGTNYFSLRAAGTMAGDNPYVWPGAYPAVNGYALTSTTAGVMSWAAVSGGSAYRTSFTDATLAGGVLTVTHNLGVRYHNVAVYDNTNTLITAATTVDTGVNTLTINLAAFQTENGGAIPGTWNVVVN